MKSIFKTVALGLLPFSLFAAEDTDDFFKLGGKNTNDKQIEFEMDAGAANPKIKAESDGTLSFSTDGTNFQPFGSGDGGGAINLISNPGYENDLSDWTNTGSGTLSVDTDAADVYLGAKSALWDAAAASDVLASESVAIPGGLLGNLCSVEVQYKGGDANIALQAYDGTDVLAQVDLVASANNFTKAQVSFTCPDSGNIQGRLFASADAAAVNVDQWVVGKGSDLVDSVSSSQWQDFAIGDSTFTGAGSTTVSNCNGSLTVSRYRVIGGTTVEWIGQAICDVGTADTSAIFIESAQAPLPIKNNGITEYPNSAQCRLTSAGSTERACVASINVTSQRVEIEVGESTDWTVGTDRRFRWHVFYEIDPADAPAEVNPIKKVETSAYHVDGSFTGSYNLGLSGNANWALQGSTAATVDVTGDSLPVKILCNGGAAQTSNCDSLAVSELVGFQFTNPRSGNFLVCFGYQHNVDENSGSSEIAQAFRIEHIDASQSIGAGDVGTAFQTLGNSDPKNHVYDLSTSEDQAQSNRLCGVFNVPAGEAAFGITEISSNNIGAPSSNVLTSVDFQVIPIEQQLPQAILFPEYKEATIDLAGNGDFTSGTIRVVRSGNIVTITNTTDVVFPSGSSPDTTAGTPPIPEWARPDLINDNVCVAGSTVLFEVTVTSGGNFGYNFRDYAGGTVNRTDLSTTGCSITYTVE